MRSSQRSWRGLDCPIRGHCIDFAMLHTLTILSHQHPAVGRDAERWPCHSKETLVASRRHVLTGLTTAIVASPLTGLLGGRQRLRLQVTVGGCASVARL
jgi:hypothetical protein